MNRSLLFLTVAVLIVGAGCSRQQSTAPSAPADNATAPAAGNEPNATTPPPSTAPGGAPTDNSGATNPNNPGGTTATPPPTGPGTTNPPQGGTSNP